MDWEADVDEALKALQETMPTVIKDVPQLAALTPFLPLLGIAMSGVQTVQQATGSSVADAVTQVAQTLTPGMDSAGALSVAATPADANATQAAVAAATAAVTTPPGGG